MENIFWLLLLLLYLLLLLIFFAETSSAGVELPAELCYIIMSPVPITTFYTFSFVPSIMHRIESYIIALNLKKMHLGHTLPNNNVPVMKVFLFISPPLFYLFHYPFFNHNVGSL